DHCVTEFIRVTDKLLPDHIFYKYCPELHTEGKTLAGTPCFIQLLGGQPSPMAENAHKAFELGAPGIDLNFGCPAKTVNRHDGGATLLKNPERLYQIISAIKNVVPPDYPVTAKVRLGFADKTLVKEIAQAVSDANAHRLTVHARTKMEGYRPPAHWEFIRHMTEVSRIPVVANGDIWSVEEYKKCIEISGCQDVALGRSLIATPDLALQIKNYVLKTQYQPLKWKEVTERFLPLFFQKSLEFRSEKYAVARAKQYLKMLSPGYSEAKELFETFKRISTSHEAYQLFLKTA
ncbi:MAG: tRNA-dihydrouridine synthase, partial [Bdellovibrionales bacterium]|nr:tRNA-dihydrouridine synthase [Bdellovibrionales bacterium]